MIPTGAEVMQWWEFRALATRLGIAAGVPTTSLSILIPAMAEPVQVVHQYAGRDEGATGGVKEVGKKRVRTMWDEPQEKPARDPLPG